MSHSFLINLGMAGEGGTEEEVVGEGAACGTADVVLIDDEASVRRLQRGTLQRAQNMDPARGGPAFPGWSLRIHEIHVNHSTGGVRGVIRAVRQAVADGGADLVVAIVDHTMPGCKGADVIKKMVGMGRPVVSVVCSGDKGNDYPDDVLTLDKPFVAQDLINAVNQALNRAIALPEEVKASFLNYSEMLTALRAHYTTLVEQYSLLIEEPEETQKGRAVLAQESTQLSIQAGIFIKAYMETTGKEEQALRHRLHAVRNFLTAVIDLTLTIEDSPDQSELEEALTNLARLWDLIIVVLEMNAPGVSNIVERKLDSIEALVVYLEHLTNLLRRYHPNSFPSINLDALSELKGINIPAFNILVLNMINNAQAAGATFVQIDVDNIEDYYVVTFSNDGKRLEDGKLAEAAQTLEEGVRGNGLRHINQIARENGWTISQQESESGTGAQIKLVIPRNTEPLREAPTRQEIAQLAI